MDNNRKSGKEETNSCSICLDTISEDCAASLIPCGHIFHVDCIKMWTDSKKSKKGVCPNCRASFLNMHFDKKEMRVSSRVKRTKHRRKERQSDEDDDEDDDDWINVRVCYKCGKPSSSPAPRLTSSDDTTLEMALIASGRMRSQGPVLVKCKTCDQIMHRLCFIQERHGNSNDWTCGFCQARGRANSINTNGTSSSSNSDKSSSPQFNSSTSDDYLQSIWREAREARMRLSRITSSFARPLPKSEATNIHTERLHPISTSIASSSYKSSSMSSKSLIHARQSSSSLAIAARRRMEEEVEREKQKQKEAMEISKAALLPIATSIPKRVRKAASSKRPISHVNSSDEDEGNNFITLLKNTTDYNNDDVIGYILRISIQKKNPIALARNLSGWLLSFKSDDEERRLSGLLSAGLLHVLALLLLALEQSDALPEMLLRAVHSVTTTIVSQHLQLDEHFMNHHKAYIHHWEHLSRNILQASRDGHRNQDIPPVTAVLKQIAKSHNNNVGTLALRISRILSSL
jgi:hypothetical protein